MTGFFLSPGSPLFCNSALTRRLKEETFFPFPGEETFPSQFPPLTQTMHSCLPYSILYSFISMFTLLLSASLCQKFLKSGSKNQNVLFMLRNNVCS